MGPRYQVVMDPRWIPFPISSLSLKLEAGSISNRLQRRVRCNLLSLHTHSSSCSSWRRCSRGCFFPPSTPFSDDWDTGTRNFGSSYPGGLSLRVLYKFHADRGSLTDPAPAPCGAVVSISRYLAAPGPCQRRRSLEF